jgi:hypothetical protein
MIKEYSFKSAISQQKQLGFGDAGTVRWVFLLIVLIAVVAVILF